MPWSPSCPCRSHRGWSGSGSRQLPTRRSRRSRAAGLPSARRCRRRGTRARAQRSRRVPETVTSRQHHGAVRPFVLAAALGVALTAASGSSASPPDGHARTDTRLVPAVEAAFPRESYRPGQRARLVVRDSSRTLTVQVLEVGPEIDTTESDTELNGVPVSPLKTIHRRPGRQPL